MKTHQEYLDSLKQEKESSASFWSSIKKNLEAKPMKRELRKRDIKRLDFLSDLTNRALSQTKELFELVDYNIHNLVELEYVMKVNRENAVPSTKEDVKKILDLPYKESDNNIRESFYHWFNHWKNPKKLTKSQHIHVSYVPPKNRTFQVAYSIGGFSKDGMPKFQIDPVHTLYGTSVKAALRKHKIGFNNLLWIKEIINTLGIVADPKTILLYRRQLPIKKLTKLQKRRYKATAKRNEKKFFNTKQHVKDIHASDRLVCIRFKDTTDFKRVRVSETKDGTFNMSDWHYTSKSKYKEFTNLKEFIAAPKPNEIEKLRKGTRDIEKKIKHIKLKHEEELIMIRKKRDKGKKKIYYRVKGDKHNYIDIGGKKSKSKNNRNVSIKITKFRTTKHGQLKLTTVKARKAITQKRREINEGKKKS